MLALGVVCLLSGLAHSVWAQPVWTHTYGGSNADYGYSVQQTFEGGYIVVGNTWSYGNGGYDVWFIKTDSSGDTLWTRTYGGSNNDYAYSVQQTVDSGYIAAGASNSSGNGTGDVYLIKTNAHGDTLWTRIYGGPNPDWGNSVQQTADHGYIIAGYTGSYGNGLIDVWLIKTDSSGDTIWTKTYGGTGSDYGESVQQTSDKGYIVAGYTNSYGSGGADVWLIKTDSLGDTLWTRIYGGSGGDIGQCVRQTSDGGYIVAGYTSSYGNGASDFWLIKTDASGDTLWTRTYGGSNNDLGYSVQQINDGGYILVGYTTSYGNGNGDVWLIKTDSLGDTLWTATYGGTGYDYGRCVRQTSNGGYIVAGYTNSYGNGDSDVWLLKTRADGSVGAEEPLRRHPVALTDYLVQPNPCVSFARVPGHETECFILRDITGGQVAVCKGDRIGAGLRPGVYFLSRVGAKTGKATTATIVKAAD